MCKINFDEQAVRNAFTERAEREKTALYWVNPIQIYHDLYDGSPVGGIKLHFIQKIQSAMVKEIFRATFVEHAKREHRDLNQVGVWHVAEEVLGTWPQMGITQIEYLEAREVAQEVWYDMIIEEAQAICVSQPIEV